MPDWHRLVVLGCVLLVTVLVARLVDRRIARKDLPPEAQTRYRVLRRSITASVIFIGLVSALLVIPQVRAVAGGLLASSAVLGLVIGFAARSTLANWVAGLLIALAQPIRLGDLVCIAGEYGTVEEIGLTYTRIRTDDLDRLVIPNEKLASDTIRNSTLAGRDTLAEISVQVPLTTELGPLLEAVRDSVADERRTEVRVTGLADKATVTVRAWIDDASKSDEYASALRLRVHDRLRAQGAFA
jgi:small-conductance mechanosensitive channel